MAGFCSRDIRRADGVAGAPLDLLADDDHDGDHDDHDDHDGAGDHDGDEEDWTHLVSLPIGERGREWVEGPLIGDFDRVLSQLTCLLYK